MNRPHVVLIDGAAERRTRLCALIEGLGHWVADYRSPAEFDRRATWASLYLVADESRMLQSMTILLSRFERPAYVIAYGAEPAVHDVVEAMKNGASDYLAWPFNAAALRSRLANAGSRALLVQMDESDGGRRTADRAPGLLTTMAGGLRGRTLARG